MRKNRGRKKPMHKKSYGKKRSKKHGHKRTMKFGPSRGGKRL